MLDVLLGVWGKPVVSPYGIPSQSAGCCKSPLGGLDISFGHAGHSGVPCVTKRPINNRKAKGKLWRPDARRRQPLR
jgi:hypothetical protein